MVQLTKGSGVNVARDAALVGLMNDSADTVDGFLRSFSFSAV